MMLPKRPYQTELHYSYIFDGVYSFVYNGYDNSSMSSLSQSSPAKIWSMAIFHGFPRIVATSHNHKFSFIMNIQQGQNPQPVSVEEFSMSTPTNIHIVAAVNIEMQPVEHKEENIQVKKTPSAMVR